MNRSRLAAAFGLMLALTMVTDALAQTTRRPRAPRGADPMTASISGTVTAQDTGAPIRGAQVRLNTGGSYRRLATTGGDGRFELTNLPAGEYRLSVSQAGFAPMQYGQRRPLEAPESIGLSEGERFTANVALPRGSAIYGRVFDRFGDPVAGARVQALRARMVEGQPRMQSVGPADQTDDTGAYRVYGLPPGEYYVAASTGPAEGVVQRDPPVYYPGTPSFSEAVPVLLGSGADAAADFQLAPARNARVAGIVLSASGEPVEAMVQLTSEVVSMGPSIEGSSRPAMMLIADSGPDGRFTIENVPPGPYMLRASGSFGAGVLAGVQASNGRAGITPAMRELIARGPETAYMPLVVTGDDVSGITLTLRRGGTLTGRFVADSGVVGPLPAGLRVETRFAGGGSGMSMTPRTQSGLFRMVASGPFYLNVQGLTDVWAVSRITVDGADVTDGPIDLNGQNATARIVLTDRVTSVSGIVQARDGGANRHAVVVFSEDSTRWAYPSRYVRATRADARGRFRISRLPPNERYLAVAVDYLEEGEEHDSRLLERLRNQATSFSLSQGEERSLVLDPIAR